jgi:hypothetical protein
MEQTRGDGMTRQVRFAFQAVAVTTQSRQRALPERKSEARKHGLRSNRYRQAVGMLAQ